MLIKEIAIYFIVGLLLLGFMVVYLKIANRFGITDNPNHRSSHTMPIVRGAGIIFYLAVLIAEIFLGFEHPYFTAGLSILAILSFVDDLKPLSNRLRISFHLVAVVLMGLEIELSILPWWIWLLISIVTIGAMNAYNFMDGINGITGIYSLVTLCTLTYIGIYRVDFISTEMLVMVIISVLIFGFFNFRKDAVCFAGDVGSFTMAYFLIFCIVSLISISGDLSFILLLSVYGVDSILTIIHRLKKKENIFKAHRSHLYQYLANQMKMDHLKVAIFYGIIQLAINIIIVYNFQYWDLSPVVLGFIILLPVCIGYFYIKSKIERKLELNEG